MSKLTNIVIPQVSKMMIGFDTPLEMLKECHRKIRAQCATLERLVAHLKAHGSDQAAGEAASAIVRYFDLAAPKHHADEEQDLLPALFESVAGSDAVCIREIADALIADHRVLDREWDLLRFELCNVMQEKSDFLGDTEVFSFIRHYQKHITFEEDYLFPIAERLLSSDILEQIGFSMQLRRRDP